MTQVKETKVVTGKIRSSFLYVWEPKEDLNGNLKYSLEVLLPKTDSETLDTIKVAINNAIFNKWGANPPNGLAIPLRDGDIAGPTGLGNKDVVLGAEPYAGHFFFTPWNKKPVTLLDANRQPILSESDIKSGDYFHASLDFYGYEVKDNKTGKIIKRGVGASLRGLMFIESGEALGSDFDATDDFNSIPTSNASGADLDFLS